MGLISYLIDLMTGSCEAAWSWIADWTVEPPWPYSYTYGKRTRCEELVLAKTRYLDDEWTTTDYFDFGVIVLAAALPIVTSIVMLCNIFLPRILEWRSRLGSTTLDSKHATILKCGAPSDDQVWKQCDSCHRLVRIQRERVRKKIKRIN
ncbi:uncharacterized protein LOC105439965 [Strongylocentrotus purpuratus]|uniref:Anoctamin n=1 Tax=Strongylocentrotus purpuratus TaxID=7668 RepID=A0A7M7HHL1_STRPU|nr:uncharacterized protein LOC105439965 [Strongylocentrotus purpuratus]|eukprot:XP_011667839.1 PREDICTED: uncharacterized protein LOC105439965 [Strongylocentrotus purpuratus]